MSAQRTNLPSHPFSRMTAFQRLAVTYSSKRPVAWGGWSGWLSGNLTIWCLQLSFNHLAEAMILEYSEAHQRYFEISEETLRVCRDVSPSEYITPHRLGACSGDFLGSAASAFEAYQRYLPWILDDQHEMNLQFNRDGFFVPNLRS